VTPAILPHPSIWLPLVERALAEDLGSGDVTSNACLPASLQVEAEIEARAPLVLCGVGVAAACFAAVDPALRFEALRGDGELVAPGTPLARVSGGARAVFAGERIALNFLGRLCGIATLTRRYVEAVAGTGARILDTRKTLPGWRALDKYAVAAGGGTNHRFGLYDAVLIKDNHVAAAGGVGAAVQAARAGAAPHLAIQCEVESAAQAEEALAAGASMLLLDNRTPAELRELVARFGARASLEASGGVNLANVRAVAETGVHRISIGALTHSAIAADVALEVRGRKDAA
jgi:nicotinate-nucleotide pyrophosphorylase (carboxylating)